MRHVCMKCKVVEQFETIYIGERSGQLLSSSMTECEHRRVRPLLLKSCVMSSIRLRAALHIMYV